MLIITSRAHGKPKRRRHRHWRSSVQGGAPRSVFFPKKAASEPHLLWSRCVPFTRIWYIRWLWLVYMRYTRSFSSSRSERKGQGKGWKPERKVGGVSPRVSPVELESVFSLQERKSANWPHNCNFGYLPRGQQAHVTSDSASAVAEVRPG